ncbi:hypothetical protein OSTOST_14290, partial [Ostertagia ostertagi]
ECKKGEDDPIISLRTRKARAEGDWRLVSGTAGYTTKGYNETYDFDGTNKHKIDYVISSGPPHSMHLIALGLKKKFPHVKWMADFRDPWTNIDFYEKLMLSTWADKKHHKQELSILKNADSVVSIGQAMSDEFDEMYRKASGLQTHKFKVITNGYDEDDVSGAVETKDSKFSIAHIGAPILAIGPTDGDLAKIINETKSGLISDFEDEEIARLIICFLITPATQPSESGAV